MNTPTEVTTYQSEPVSSPITMGTVLVMCALTCVITLMAGYFGSQIATKRGWMGPSAEEKVVYLNFEKVVEMGITKSLEGGVLGMDEAKVAADKFQGSIAALMDQYAQAGYVIINDKAVIKGSAKQDLTPEFVAKLGLK
jgi:hypothetical protein